MLSRCGQIKTAFPGGCTIGKRPIDLHIKVLEEMGAKFLFDDDYNIIATADQRLRGARIHFEKQSIGATQNLIMAATLAEGVTEIYNAATSPDISDLIKMLNAMGACIDQSNEKITITGVENLNGCVHRIAPDHIEAGTYALAAVITKGRLELEGINVSDIDSFIRELKTMGATIETSNNGIIISGENDSFQSLNIQTGIYPNFPTDMQAQFMAALCVIEGTSTVEENIFENRLQHAHELNKLGASITLEQNKATIIGKKKLIGSTMCATDLRSVAALILASLVAEGESLIRDSHYLFRGYEALPEKLNSCGADITVL